MQWIEEKTKSSLAILSKWWDSNSDPTSLRYNIENPIGLSKIPTGVAGPLLFCGEAVQGPILAPLATTEILVVASTCRGAKALTLAGGVHTYTGRQIMTQDPVFILDSTSEVPILGKWLQENVKRIQTEASQAQSNHTKLQDIIWVQHFNVSVYWYWYLLIFKLFSLPIVFLRFNI